MRTLLLILLLICERGLLSQVVMDSVYIKIDFRKTTQVVEKDYNYFHIHLQHIQFDQKEYRDFFKTLKSMKGVSKTSFQSPGIFLWDLNGLSQKEIKWYIQFLKNSKWVQYLSIPIWYTRGIWPSDEGRTMQSDLIPRNKIITIDIDSSAKWRETALMRLSDHGLNLWLNKRGFRFYKKENNYTYIIPIEKIETQQTYEDLRALADEPLIKSLWVEYYFPNELE